MHTYIYTYNCVILGIKDVIKIKQSNSVLGWRVLEGYFRLGGLKFLSEMCQLSRGLNELKVSCMCISGGRRFQIGGIACAKALWWECAWHVLKKNTAVTTPVG